MALGNSTIVVKSWRSCKMYKNREGCIITCGPGCLETCQQGPASDPRLSRNAPRRSSQPHCHSQTQTSFYRRKWFSFGCTFCSYSSGCEACSTSFRGQELAQECIEATLVGFYREKWTLRTLKGGRMPSSSLSPRLRRMISLHLRHPPASVLLQP